MSAHRIAYVTSEIAPFAKTGGLADVSSALPIALSEAGHDVRVFAPLYSAIDVAKFEFEAVPELADVPLQLGNRRLRYSVFRAPLPGTKVVVHFVHCPALYDRASLYTNDADEHVRFALLSHASIEACQRWAWAPEVFHCHDWQTALIPALLKSVYAWDRLFQRTGTVLTIHNLGYQGSFPAEVLPDTGLEGAAHLLHPEDLRAGRIGFLKTGIIHADFLTTVSPTYAKEIQTEAFGVGLHEWLARRGDTLVGIRNGIDTNVWNPRTDEHLAVRYSAKNVARKEKCKESLLEEVGMPSEPGVPLVGMITRLTYQKGIDLLFDALPEVLSARSVQLVVLGDGESKYERFFSGLQDRFPGRAWFYRGFHGPLAHRIEAGADVFLMPSLYEPCGLNQMYSLVYGTIPVVRRTGGLADTVTLYDPDTGRGNGIVFEHPTPQGARWGLETAIDLYEQPDVWKVLIQNAMAEDFSWDQPVREYERVYERVAAERTAEV